MSEANPNQPSGDVPPPPTPPAPPQAPMNPPQAEPAQPRILQPEAAQPAPTHTPGQPYQAAVPTGPGEPATPSASDKMAQSAKEAGAAMKAMGAAAWQKAGETWQASNDPSRQSGSFASRLFDMSFTRYVTPSVAKLLYVLSLIGIWVGWLKPRRFFLDSFSFFPGLSEDPCFFFKAEMPRTIP